VSYPVIFCEGERGWPIVDQHPFRRNIKAKYLHQFQLHTVFGVPQHIDGSGETTL